MNQTSTTGINPVYPQPNPNRCPGCGRCKECGQPWPVVPVYPVNPVYPVVPPMVPYYPGYPYGPWTISYNGNTAGANPMTIQIYKV